MLRQVVESQIIHSVGYDADSMVLEVQFRNGWVYRYEAVPRDVFQAFMSAPSHGKYLKRYIVDDYVTHRIR
ncbi:KTSC domain-containing protein [Actinomycetota bacterium]